MLVVRGGLVESSHRVVWAVADAQGLVSAASGPDAGEMPILPRSAAKPLQALPAVHAGVLGRFGMDASALALACASHAGTDEAAEICRSMLHACGLRESDLRCGTVPARDPRVAASQAGRGPLHHMCSGNHALALAWCMVSGVSPESYLDAESPVQVAMRGAVAEACGVATMREGVDGCGMRAYEVPLASVASAYARLATGALGAAGEETVRAMRAMPDLVGYHGSIDTELMLAEDGLVAKVGAEAVLCVGLADGRGLALKVLDGAERALGPAAVLLVREVLGLAADRPGLETLLHTPVISAGHRVVGELVPGFA